MNASATLLLAVGMSMDAFAAAIGRGAAAPRAAAPLGPALRAGLVFGSIEAVAPLLGWLAGATAADWLTAIDHWLAFGVLGVLGAHMALRAARGGGSDGNAPQGLRHLCLTAAGTSLDAMAVGVTLAVLGVDIVVAALAIGMATAVMATCGTLLGRWVGPALGRYAEFAGGIGLIVLGGKILLEHTLG